MLRGGELTGRRDNRPQIPISSRSRKGEGSILHRTCDRPLESGAVMIVLALTLLVLAASAAATGYVDGREYVYRYNSAIYTGYPRIKPQEAGYVYSAKLVIQPEGDSAVFKVEDAKKAQFNGEFEDVVSAPHAYTDLPPQADNLFAPFRVTRRNGIVTHFEVSRDEPAFSMNLKRGIASLFNLNFEQVESELSTDDNDILTSDPDEHYYTVYEEGILGDCETAYVIEHHPHDRSNNIVLNVTKVRDLHSCRTRPNQAYGHDYHGRECGQNEYEKAHTLHGSAQYHYSIRGDRHHYVIEKIRAESDIAYTPYPLRGERVSTTVKRSLELVEERPVAAQLQVPDDLVSHTSLVYDFAFQTDFRDPVDLKKPHYLYHLTGSKVPISDISNQMEELVNVYSDDTYAEKIRDRDYPAKFVELLRSFATLGYDDIEALYKAHADIPASGASEEQQRYRNLFMDTLVNLGTNPAFLFGKHLVQDKKASPAEAEYFIKQLQFHLKEVSEVLLQKYQELCESDYVKRRTQLHTLCVTSLGSVVYDRCVARYHPEGQDQTAKNSCPQEEAVKFFSYLARLYDQTSNEQLRMAYVKAAGKLGVKEALPYLAPYVKGQNTRNRLQRDNAIWALQNVGWKHPKKVRALLIPLLFNRTEATELRMSAFTVLLQYQPRLYEVEGVARAIKHDPDDQLRSYVYSAFKHIANTTHPCYRKQAHDFQYALRILEDVKEEFEEYDYSYSKLFSYGGFDPDYDLGGSTRFAYFASDAGYIPRKVYMAFEDFVGGKSTIPFALTLRQYGLEKFFDRILGPDGSLGRRSAFDLFKRRGKRDAAGARGELDEVKEKLNLPVHDYDSIEGELFFKYMGHQTFSYYFNDRTFQQFFREGRFVIPNIPAALQKIPAFRNQRFQLFLDRFYVLPTEAGVPLVLDYKQPVYVYHRNKESSFRVEPGFFPEDRGGQWPDHVRLETDGHLAVDKNLIAYMGVVVPFDQVFFGGGINRRSTLSLPLKLKFDLVVKRQKLKTHWTPVAPHEIYHFKYEPFTFVDSYANSVPQVLENGYRPVRRIHNHEIERHFLHDEFGVGFDIKAEYENEFNDFGSWADFFLKKDFRDKFYYLYANPHFEPYRVDVQFSHAKQAATRELEVDFTYRYHDHNWIIPHFAEENFEDYGGAKEDRGPLFTYAVKADVHGRGDKERKIHAVAAWTRELLWTFHKLDFFYERTPFASYETEAKKICGSSYLKYPRYDPVKLETLDTLDIDHTVHTELKVHFGRSCDADQKIRVQGMITQSDQQRELEKRRNEPDTPEHDNEYSRWYHQCLEENKRGFGDGKGCVAYWDLVTTVQKYIFHIKHENLSPAFLNRTYLLDRILKYALYTHSDHDEVDVHNPVDEVHIEANFSSRLPVADIRVRKPAANTNYYNVYFPHYAVFRSYPLTEEHYIKNSFSDIFCSVEEGAVFTFDRYRYTLPPIDCYKVVARDCSPKEHFTVLAAKIKHPTHHQAVKVFLGDHKVEVLPEDSGTIVRVDGQQIPVAKNHPYLHKEGDEILFYVTFGGLQYTIHSKRYGLIVSCFSNAVSVQVSLYYRAKLCGLCGNYNGQKYDGSSTPGGCYYKDEKAYAYAHVVPSDTCTAPMRPEAVCPAEGTAPRFPSSFSSLTMLDRLSSFLQLWEKTGSTSSGFGCTRLRTAVLEVATGMYVRTCFSTEPVAECADHCQSPRTVSRRLSFHCLPAKDDSTKALLRERETRVLLELSRKSRDYEATLGVPDGCYKK